MKIVLKKKEENSGNVKEEEAKDIESDNVKVVEEKKEAGTASLHDDDTEELNDSGFERTVLTSPDKQENLLKSKQDLLDGLIEQQKMLISKLVKGRGGMKAEEKTKIMKLLKELTNSIDRARQDIKTSSNQTRGLSSVQRIRYTGSYARPGSSPMLRPTPCLLSQPTKSLSMWTLELKEQLWICRPP